MTERLPEGAPFTKYKPKTHMIDPVPKAPLMRDYIPSID